MDANLNFMSENGINVVIILVGFAMMSAKQIN